MCTGSPEPFVISRYRTRELGVNRAQCKIQSQSYFFPGNVCDPKQKAHVTLAATIGDTQQITNGLQHLYLCEGDPKPFVIEHYRRR